jgi:hypothetical protein
VYAFPGNYFCKLDLSYSTDLTVSRQAQLALVVRRKGITLKVKSSHQVLPLKTSPSPRRAITLFPSKPF